MQRETVVVDDQDHCCEGDGHAPEDVAGDCGAEGVIGVWEEFDDFSACCAGYDGCGDGEELHGVDALESVDGVAGHAGGFVSGGCGKM